MRRLIEPSHLDLCCLQKSIIIACGSERVKLHCKIEIRDYISQTRLCELKSVFEHSLPSFARFSLVTAQLVCNSLSNANKRYYRIYSNNWDTLKSYHTCTCTKTWTSPFSYPLMCIKNRRVANSVDPDQMPRSAASDLGLRCLLTFVSVPTIRDFTVFTLQRFCNVSVSYLTNKCHICILSGSRQDIRGQK